MNYSLILIIAIAIIAAIALGYCTNINTGLYAIAFSYLIGCYIMGKKPAEITAMWPIKIFFVILAVSLFYNFAIINGTLEKMAMHILYRCRKLENFLIFIIFLIAVLVAGMGAGYFAVMAFLCPLTLMLTEKTSMGKLEGVIAVSFGALAGANFMTSMSGLIFRGLMEAAGYGEQVFSYGTSIFVMTMIVPVLLLIGLMMLGRKRRSDKSDAIEIEKPEAFTKKQKINLWLIFILIVTVLSVPMFKLIMPNNSYISILNRNMDVSFIAIILSIIALCLKLADEKAVIARVPWNTLIMICGVGMLIEIAVAAGTIDLLASWIGTNIPTFFVPVVLTIIAGIMSFFSSTLGVVAPALFPVVPVLAAATGISPMVLFTCIIMGAQSTGGISPFSSGGSLALGSCATEEDRETLFDQLMFKATPTVFFVVVVVGFIYGIVWKG